jgi:putative addiction module antidote
MGVFAVVEINERVGHEHAHGIEHVRVTLAIGDNEELVSAHIGQGCGTVSRCLADEKSCFTPSAPRGRTGAGRAGAVPERPRGRGNGQAPTSNAPPTWAGPFCSRRSAGGGEEMARRFGERGRYDVCNDENTRMVLELKLRKVGNSVGVVLPKDAMARLNVQEGDSLCLTDAPDGGLRMTPVTEGREQFARQMKEAEDVIRRYRNTLRELAK